MNYSLGGSVKNRFIAVTASLCVLASSIVLSEPADAQDDLVKVSIDETKLNVSAPGFNKLGEFTGNGYPVNKCNVSGSDLCGADPYRLMAHLNAPTCLNSKIESFCIAGLTARDRSGSLTKIKLKPVSGTEIPAIPAYATPRSGSALTATIGDQPVLVVVQSMYVGNLQRKLSGLPELSGNKMSPLRVTSTITPFKWVDMGTCKKDFPRGDSLYLDEENSRCAYAEDWSPELKQTQLQLELNLPLNSPKWGLGRVEKLNVSGAESNGHFTFKLEGYATALSTYRDELPRGSLITAGASWLSFGAKILNGVGRSSMFVIDSATSLGKVRPTGTSTVWALVLDTLDYSTYFNLGKPGDWNQFKNCTSTGSSFVGFLATNGIAYDPSPPAVNQGAIEFQAKDFHFDVNGKVREGYFTFSMTNEFAKCIFNLDSTPNFAAARVEITDDKGEKVVALTVVSQDENWLNFAASGFGYSSKVMKVSLTPTSKRNQIKFVGSKLTANAVTISSLTKDLRKLRSSNPKASKLICVGNFKAKNLTLGLVATKAICSSVAKQLGGLSPRPKAVATTPTSLSGNVIDFIISE